MLEPKAFGVWSTMVGAVSVACTIFAVVRTKTKANTKLIEQRPMTPLILDILFPNDILSPNSGYKSSRSRNGLIHQTLNPAFIAKLFSQSNYTRETGKLPFMAGRVFLIAALETVSNLPPKGKAGILAQISTKE
jgi:hypothetical protein